VDFKSNSGKKKRPLIQILRGERGNFSSTFPRKIFTTQNLKKKKGGIKKGDEGKPPPLARVREGGNGIYQLKQ